MSMVRVYAAICPKCGYDVATVRRVVSHFEVYCNTEGSGCGHVGPLVSNEALAVAGWNAKAEATFQRLQARNRPPGVTAALRAEALRRPA